MPRINIVFHVIVVLLLNSCGSINSNRILFFEAGTSITIDSLSQDVQATPLETGDIIAVAFYPNQGEKKIIGTDTDKSDGKTNLQMYTIDNNGEVRLPLLGSIQVAGKTISETENQLKEALTPLIKEPFVEVRIENERVILFAGKGQGQVIPLQNKNTTLLEIIALGGGLKDNAKSNEIHLIRKVNGVRKTYRFDLSSISNVRAADLVVQNHDIVVVNYYPRKFQNALKEINPYLNIITAGLALVSIIVRLTP